MLSISGCFHHCNKIPEAGQFTKRKKVYLSKDLAVDILHNHGVGSSEKSSHEGPNAIKAAKENQNPRDRLCCSDLVQNFAFELQEVKFPEKVPTSVRGD